MGKRRIWIILLVVLLAGGGAAVYLQPFSEVSLADEPPEPEVETATVTQGDITLTADGSGELVPAAEVDELVGE